jgi:hypothetical protein
MMASSGDRSTARSRMTGNPAARNGSIPHVELAGGGGLLGTVGAAVDHHAAGAADALAAVALKGDGLLAGGVELLVEEVEHLEERGVGADGLLVGLEAAGGVGRGLAPHLEGDVDGLAVRSGHVGPSPYL